jgi:hypothetical protein
MNRMRLNLSEEFVKLLVTICLEVSISDVNFNKIVDKEYFIHEN